MPEYRRSFIPGGTYFFTLVTFDRAPFLTQPEAREILHFAWETVKERFPFTTEAVCLLPDHLHCIWSLPEGDTNYSIRIKEIKRLFTFRYREYIGSQDLLNDSRIVRAEAPVWQRRFWEHTIRDERDYHQHLDYIHYNPVKHGLVQKVADWPWSSFQRFVRMGWYEPHWGGEAEKAIQELNCGE
jgi:putative transposase